MWADTLSNLKLKPRIYSAQDVSTELKQECRARWYSLSNTFLIVFLWLFAFNSVQFQFSLKSRFAHFTLLFYFLKMLCFSLGFSSFSLSFGLYYFLFYGGHTSEARLRKVNTVNRIKTHNLTHILVGIQNVNKYDHQSLKRQVLITFFY